MTLTPKTRQALKAKAHPLKPIVMVGNHGVSDAVKKEVVLALIAHELIKVRISTLDRDEKKAMVAELCEASEAELVQLIGNICVLYKKNLDKVAIATTPSKKTKPKSSKVKRKSPKTRS